METNEVNDIFPIEILYGDLTLEEIGAILVIFFNNRIPDFSVWDQDEDFKRVVKEFKNSNILKTVDGETTLDLSWI